MQNREIVPLSTTGSITAQGNSNQGKGLNYGQGSTVEDLCVCISIFRLIPTPSNNLTNLKCFKMTEVDLRKSLRNPRVY